LSVKTLEFFRTPKIVVRGVARRLTAALDNEGVGLLVAVHGIVPTEVDPQFLTGLLNSKLFNWLHLNSFYSARIPEGSLRYPVSFFKKLPIRLLDLTKPRPRNLHERIVALVQRMQRLNEKKHSGRLAPSELARLDRETAATNGEIDDLVFALYDITKEERMVIDADL
jgi:hypothetical protein